MNSEKLSPRAESDIKDLLNQGFDYKSIRQGLEDADALEKLGYGDDDQDLVEEMYTYCLKKDEA